VKAIRLGEITLDKSWPSMLVIWLEASPLTQVKPLAEKAQRRNAGQMILVRKRHVKRMKDELMDIGTWNLMFVVPYVLVTYVLFESNWMYNIIFS
jgi:hypothetical protein